MTGEVANVTAVMSPVILRLVGLAIALGALGYGMFAERHTVRAFAFDEERTLPGAAWSEAPETALWPASFCEGATVDGFVRQGDGLYSVFTTAAGQASIRDCKT